MKYLLSLALAGTDVILVLLRLLTAFPPLFCACAVQSSRMQIQSTLVVADCISLAC